MTLKRIMMNSYVQNWYNHGGTAMAGLGEVAQGDFVAVRAAQANEASRTFGQTDIDKPGVRGVGYPRMSGVYAVKFIDYWSGEAKRFSGPSFNGVLTLLFGGSAHYEAWLRAVANLLQGAGNTIRAKARFLGNQLLSDGDTKLLWDVADQVIIPMGAIRDMPSQWEMIKTSVAESIEDLAKTAPFRALGSLLTAAKFLGIGLVAYVVYDSVRKR